jgi:SAM-dependent methyltransferase
VPGYDAATYGDRMAEVYDEWFVVPSDTEDKVGFLFDLAGLVPVLELGIGTGRVALPLAQRGHEVHGVDAYEAMVEKLRAKTGGESIPVSIGDFAELDIEGGVLPSVRCLQHLLRPALAGGPGAVFLERRPASTGGGVFVIEAFVPDMTRWDRNQRIETSHIGDDSVVSSTRRGTIP